MSHTVSFFNYQCGPCPLSIQPRYYAVLPAFLIARKIGLQRMEADALGNLGKSYAKSRRLDEALECYQQANAIFQSLHNVFGILGTQRDMKVVRVMQLVAERESSARMHDHDQARKTFEQPIAILLDLGEFTYAAQLNERILSGTGQYQVLIL